ncbi:hypothetical protein HBB16_02495 [Pseudonocardia sp. MCCB 268]|nr:hypothetical protein [Pseudonocardia cytotoxica]
MANDDRAEDTALPGSTTPWNRRARVRTDVHGHLSPRYDQVLADLARTEALALHRVRAARRNARRDRLAAETDRAARAPPAVRCNDSAARIGVRRRAPRPRWRPPHSERLDLDILTAAASHVGGHR